ncbi:SH3 domain-containing protein [Heterostelium album PN500]|uniref:SH3 domain-containing protein n=1 Tax=Heterostelium pallidum (strain ATCC 26659 / Pp 5 / PN500) TaxID=670386 RepID=D3BIJ4_HETP5|nr:SH3 domain-containing protein [Heterostelium album PN500]EFA78618.1 SH3 domain-containing protein [Heterostelium album PN500]|eukprot:XP_020430742.1 SH3 domain-containing protein [Heterostelium album PN500]
MAATIKTRGFSEDLWDKFDGVVKKVDNGKVFTNLMSKFLLKQQQIESLYSKSMIKLCKDKSFAPDMEIGTIRDSWQIYRDQVEAISVLHEEFSNKLEKIIVSGIDSYLEDSRKQRKGLVAAGEKLTKDLKAAENNESKAKINYDKLKKKQEEAHEELSKQPPGAKEQKARKNLESATKAADKADNEYRDSVKVLQQNQSKFYHDEMPKILDDLQRFEVDRIDRTKDWLLDVINNAETMPAQISTHNENIKKSIESIDRDKDIQSFILEKMSGAQKPPEAQYEPYQPSNHLTTFSMVMSPSSSPIQHGVDMNSLTSSQQLSQQQLAQQQISQQQLAQQQRRSLNSSSSSTHSGNDPLPGLPPKPASAMNMQSNDETVRALYDYNATEENELSFKSTNVIKVIMRDESGWWQGSVVGGDGKIGMFPSNFVESTDSQKKKVDVSGGKCKVLYDYHSDCEGELEIREGETLTIEYEDEGWFYGSNEKGSAGRFPSNYVQLIKV